MIKYQVYLNANSNKTFIFAASILENMKVMSSLQIQVFMNHDAKSSGKRIFERVVEFSDAVSIDYSNIIKVLRFFFGQKSIVSFNIY